MPEAHVGGVAGDDAEVRAQAGQVSVAAGGGEQRVLVFLIQGRQRPRKVADVGADPEVPDSPCIDCYMKGRDIQGGLLGKLAGSRRRQLPGVQRELLCQRGDSAPDLFNHIRI